MELKYIETKEKMTEGGTHYVRDIYTIGAYTVEVDNVAYSDGMTHRDINVSLPYTPGGERSYLPEIYCYDGFMGSEKPRFKIQTVAYGAMEIEEYKKFLEAQQTAMEVAEVLTEQILK